MENKLLYAFRSGKNIKLIYYIKNILGSLIPDTFFQMRLRRKLESVSGRKDKDYILHRVNYYNKLLPGAQLPDSIPALAEKKLRGHKVYIYDTRNCTRWFPQQFRLSLHPGDVNYVPSEPSIVKSRPITEGNENGVILKLNKIRHFIFVHDKKAFTAKKDITVFRGKIKGKEQRVRFFEMYFGHPMCDLGDTGRDTDNASWHVGKLTINEQLDYKFVLALEGNDVASNLKWVMSSNSIAVMPRPTCETWFMEGTLIPNYHYIEIKPDFSDLEERLKYYINHPDEAQEIIEHAHTYIEQFKDEKREQLISLLVLDKYFKMTGQSTKR